MNPEHRAFDQGDDAPEHPTTDTVTEQDSPADRVESSPGRGGFGDPPQ